MTPVLLIAGRELRAYFSTLSGYLVIALVLAVDGVLFNTYALGGVEKRSSDVLRMFFFFASGTTMIASVAVAMRLFAEERQLGTLDVLIAAPISALQIVLGKFLSALGFVSSMTALTVFLPLMILVRGSVSVGHLAAGYVGLFLLGAACVAVATLGSALARSQLLAAVYGGCLVAGLVLTWRLAQVTEAPLSELLASLALYERHFAPFQRGTIHLRDVAYYLAVTYVALCFSVLTVDARRWR